MNLLLSSSKWSSRTLDILERIPRSMISSKDMEQFLSSRDMSLFPPRVPSKDRQPNFSKTTGMVSTP